MSQWANEHPEQMEEIARLPMREQNAALRAAIGYDPDRIRDELEASAGDSPSSHPSVESAAPVVDLDDIGCNCCGAPKDEDCQWWCMGEQES